MTTEVVEFATALDDLRLRCANAADAADRVAGALRSGRCPEPGDAELVNEVVAAFDAVVGLAPGERPPLPDLEAMTERLEQARVAEREQARVHALAQLEGPELPPELLTEVREAALSGDGQGLATLAELIEASTKQGEFRRTSELAARAHEELPEHWRSLIYAALNRALILPEREDNTPTQTPENNPTKDDDLADLDTLIAKTFPPTQQPTRVEQPAAVQKPTTQEQSTPEQNSTPKQNLPPNQQPERVQQGEAVQEPTAHEQPAARQDPAHEREPAAVQRAGVVVQDSVAEPQPVRVQQSAVVQEPAAEQDLVSAQASAPGQGSAVVQQAVQEPASQEQSVARQEPVPVQESVPVQDAAVAQKPEVAQEVVPGQEFVAEREPVVVRQAGVVVQGSVGGLGRVSGQLGRGVGVTSEVVWGEVVALRGGWFGVAARLRGVAGRARAERRARECAALAMEMSAFAGPLSAEFAEAARDLSAKALANDPAGGVLAWAAAIRAGLVHPTPESTRLLEELTKVVSAQPELETVGEAFVRAARGGAYLRPGLVGRIRGTAEAAEFRREAATDASRLLEQEQHRKLKYQLATGVWRELIKEDGEIGGLLAIAAGDDSARVDEVIAQTTALRTGDAVNRLIAEATVRTTARRRAKKIVGDAHATLVKKTENALETIGCWARAVKESAAAEVETQDWRLGPLEQLQDVVGDRREAIDTALAELANGQDELLAAAVDAARGLVGQALALLAGSPLNGTEPPVSQVLNRHLLLIGDVPLDPSTLEPRIPLPVEALVRVAGGAEDWAAAFDRRAERRDHEGTQSVIAVVQRIDPDEAARLRLKRDALVDQSRKERDDWLEEIRNDIAGWLRAGVLTEDRARWAEERLRTFAGDRVDFDRVRHSIDELWETLLANCQEEIRRARALLNARRLATEDHDRIAERIEEGDLITAREFLAQLDAGNPLPTATDDGDHLRRFYPSFPSGFAGIATRTTGSWARKQETAEILSELKEALKHGRDVHDSDLAVLLKDAGVRIPELRNARRQEASEGLRLWAACGRQSTNDGTRLGAIATILKMVGLEGRLREGAKEQDRIWVDLEGVHWVGENPLPAFGSRMSPSGDRLRLLLVWRRPGPQQLIELLKGQPEDQTIMVFYFGVLSAEERQQLAAAARRRPAPVTAVLDDAAMGYLACLPEADWSAAVALTAPFTATNPYAPVGDVPDEMFYGRGAQLRDVTGRTRCSFVYGGRQLGKSALLRKAERDIRRNDPSRTVILENIQTVGKVGSAEALWPKLADKLARAGVIPPGAVQRDQVRDAVRDWARADASRQVLILLDEADAFLNTDAEDGRFENVTALRDLMDDTDDRFKVVFAGLHQTARFQSLPNQPLAHLGTPVAVGPLEPQNAFNLLVRPLTALGFRFPERLAARVIAEANNAPALVQLFAEALLARLRRNQAGVRTLPYEITAEDVEAVWRDASLVRGFRDRFEWTLNLDKRYKVIAYTVALHALVAGADETLSVSDLTEECQSAWPAGFEGCTSDGFRGLLDECVNLGVLGVAADRYRLRTPHILNLLGGIDDVQEVLDNAGEFELPDSFDAHSYRGIYREGPERSPLSIVQLARLTRPHNLVHVVAGSQALHIDRVYRTLDAATTERTDLEVLRAGRDGMPFEGAKARADRHDGHSVIVVEIGEGRSRKYFDQRVDEALKAVADCARGTLAVVLIAHPYLAPAWVHAAGRDGVELVELGRFDRPSVRQWMSEDSQQGFPDEAGQDALLASTGGWPILIGKIVRPLAEQGADRDEVLQACSSQIGDEFVHSTGVLDDPALAAAWHAIVRHDEPGTFADLVALLELEGEGNETALTEPALTEQGYSDAADVIHALRVLGALIPTGAGGQLASEPVLANATRRMGVQ